VNFKELQAMAARVRGEQRPGVYSQAHSQWKKRSKGVETCNVTACQQPLGLRWWNLSTRAFYCRGCAAKINRASTKEDQETCIALYGIPDLLVLEGSADYLRLKGEA